MKKKFNPLCAHCIMGIGKHIHYVTFKDIKESGVEHA